MEVGVGSVLAYALVVVDEGGWMIEGFGWKNYIVYI